MKYLKKFENILNNTPEIGDYVICKETDWFIGQGSLNPLIYIFLNFINTNIGQIVDIDYMGYDYMIKYENFPKIIQDYFHYKNETSRGMASYEIINHSKNKEELETILMSKKFNI